MYIVHVHFCVDAMFSLNVLNRQNQKTSWDDGNQWLILLVLHSNHVSGTRLYTAF